MIMKKGFVPCEYRYAGCQYYKEGICTYDSSPIKIECAKACYEDQRLDQMECDADYVEGNLI